MGSRRQNTSLEHATAFFHFSIYLVKNQCDVHQATQFFTILASVEDGTFEQMITLAQSLQIPFIRGVPTLKKWFFVIDLKCLVKKLFAHRAAPLLSGCYPLLDKR